MSDSMRARRTDQLPERSDRMAKAGLPGVRKADLHARRAVLGAVLFDALVLLRKTRLKDQAALFERDDRLVARWFNGEDPIPWEELLYEAKYRALRLALFEALVASMHSDLVEIETTIRIRRKASAA
jgi:hypothetical protein